MSTAIPKDLRELMCQSQGSGAASSWYCENLAEKANITGDPSRPDTYTSNDLSFFTDFQLYRLKYDRFCSSQPTDLERSIAQIRHRTVAALQEISLPDAAKVAEELTGLLPFRDRRAAQAAVEQLAAQVANFAEQFKQNPEQD